MKKLTIIKTIRERNKDWKQIIHLEFFIDEEKIFTPYVDDCEFVHESEKVFQSSIETAEVLAKNLNFEIEYVEKKL